MKGEEKDLPKVGMFDSVLEKIALWMGVDPQNMHAFKNSMNKSPRANQEAFKKRLEETKTMGSQEMLRMMLRQEHERNK
jgi:hypothetical protein